jgi:hypothetical protein
MCLLQRLHDCVYTSKQLAQAKLERKEAECERLSATAAQAQARLREARDELQRSSQVLYCDELYCNTVTYRMSHSPVTCRIVHAQCAVLLHTPLMVFTATATKVVTSTSIIAPRSGVVALSSFVLVAHIAPRSTLSS